MGGTVSCGLPLRLFQNFGIGQVDMSILFGLEASLVSKGLKVVLPWPEVLSKECGPQRTEAQIPQESLVSSVDACFFLPFLRLSILISLARIVHQYPGSIFNFGV